MLKTVVFAVTSLLIIVGFQNCAESFEAQVPSVVGVKTSASTLTGSALEKSAIKILEKRCLSCHGADGAGEVSDINNTVLLLQTGLIVPGAPEESLLIQSIESGRMPPPPAKMAAGELDILKSAIGDLANYPMPNEELDLEDSQNGVSGSATPPPTPTYSLGVSQILTAKCLRCHATGNANGGVTYGTYAETMRTVVPKSVNASALYTSIALRTMGTKAGLTSSEKTAILDVLKKWIDAGAPR